MKCNPYCSHTDEEHEAYKAGIEAGKNGEGDASPYSPQSTPRLFECWQAGYSMGQLDRQMNVLDSVKKSFALHFGKLP